MRASRDIANRMRDMLTQDKVGIKDGFAISLKNDLQSLLSNYFQLEEKVYINITQQDDGQYAISIRTTASRIKQFESTLDARRF